MTPSSAASWGGVINSSTRSGNNQVHGTAFEFMRNSAFNARDFFATYKSQFAYNMYGGALGGPVYLPKVYNGKNPHVLLLYV